MVDMYGDDDGELSNQEKAAILFIALGPEYSAKLFQHMDDDGTEQLKERMELLKKELKQTKRLMSKK